MVNCICGRKLFDIPTEEEVEKQMPDGKTKKMIVQVDPREYVERMLKEKNLGIWRVWQTEVTYSAYIMHRDCYEEAWKNFKKEEISAEKFLKDAPHL